MRGKRAGGRRETEEGRQVSHKAAQVRRIWGLTTALKNDLLSLNLYPLICMVGIKSTVLNRK